MERDPGKSAEVNVGEVSAPEGLRCTVCGFATLLPQVVCPSCGGTLRGETFSSTGTVWSTTRVHVPVPGLEPPYGLAYVDLADAGPRVLALCRANDVQIGATVTLVRRGGQWTAQRVDGRCAE